MKINGIEVKIFDNIKWLYRTCYNEVASAIKKSARPVIGFATGSSPLPLYKIIVEEFGKGKISFKNCVSFNLDEYIGFNASDKNSYAYYMNNNLFNHIDINRKNINLIDGSAKSCEKEAKRYDRLLAKENIDLQILGIGTSGHIGFNEPGTNPGLGTHVTELNQRTINDNSRFFNNNLELTPKSAITMGIKDILKAKRIILIATGKAKANVIIQMLYGAIHPGFPASYLKNHKNVCLYLDKEAANLIRLN